MASLLSTLKKFGRALNGVEPAGNSLIEIADSMATDCQGGSGRGLDPVNELPKVGDVKSLYKLPDGSIWSWYSYSKEETIEEHVELGEKYQFKFSSIDKAKIKDFLEVVKAKVTELYNQGPLPESMDNDFGEWEFLVEDGFDPGVYHFPVGVSLAFSDDEATGEAAVVLGYCVEDKQLTDATDGSTNANAEVGIWGTEVVPFYRFQNPLNEKEYRAGIEQKWFIWGGEEEVEVPIILTEEQMNSLKVEINPEWLEYMKTTYKFDIDLTMLDFLFKLKSETIIVKDEGYNRLDDPQIKAVKGGGNTYDSDDGLIFDGNGVEFDYTTNGIVINDENSYIDSEGIHLVSGSGGASEDEWVTPSVTYVQTPTKKKDTGKILRFNGKDVVASNALPYLTEEPTNDNADGLILVVIDHEPSVKYDGYLYIITEANSSEEEVPIEEPME